MGALFKNLFPWEEPMGERPKDHYEKNLALLKRHHPAAWEVMTASPVVPAGEVCSLFGRLNLRVRRDAGDEVLLHDEDNPGGDTARFLSVVPADCTGVVAMLGMGLGFSAMTLLDKRPHLRRVILLEPARGILLQAMTHMDLTELLSDPRLILGVGKGFDVTEVMKPAVRALRLETAHILIHLPSRSLDESGYADLESRVFAHVSAENVGGGTTMAYGRSFIENRMAQLTSMHGDHLMDTLYGAFEGLPIFIVAGGPSLDRNVELLHRAKGKGVIIAVDSVLPSLTAHGITPDFVTAIDMTDATYDKIDVTAPGSEGISLICSPCVTPKVPKYYPARHVFWFFSQKTMEEWNNTLLGGEILTGGASTVAHLNLLAAIVMGGSPIVFLGQDLAFAPNRSHAAHTVLTVNDEVAEDLTAKKEVVWVDGYGGRKVATNRSFFGMKQYFEKIMQQNPGHYINATEGGVHLEGTEELPLSEVLARYCGGDGDIPGRLERRIAAEAMSPPDRMFSEFRSMIRRIDRVMGLIEKTERIGGQLLKELAGLEGKAGRYASMPSLPARMQKRISELDRLGAKLDGEDRLWVLLDEVTLEGLKASERSLRRMERFERQPGHFIAWITEAVGRIVGINNVRKESLGWFREFLADATEFHDRRKDLLSLGEEGREELIRLNFEADNLVRVLSLLEEMPRAFRESPEGLFYLGVIAARRTELDRANELFERAIRGNPELSGAVARFRKKVGDEYLAYSGKLDEFDRQTVKRMLFKGLRYCGGHAGIREIVHRWLTEDLGEIRGGNASLGEEWSREVEENPHLTGEIDPVLLAELYNHGAKALTAAGDHGGAVYLFQRSLDLDPDAPLCHIHIAELLFSLERYEQGLAHLARAVELDRSYAEYWGVMGDNFQNLGQPEDAVAAYERCFLLLPENILMLKKMGDAYRSMNRVEAAEEAYRQYRLKGGDA